MPCEATTPHLLDGLVVEVLLHRVDKLRLRHRLVLPCFVLEGGHDDVDRRHMVLVLAAREVRLAVEGKVDRESEGGEREGRARAQQRDSVFVGEDLLDGARAAVGRLVVHRMSDLGRQ
jgi:hypothetical protein